MEKTLQKLEEKLSKREEGK